MDKRFFKIKEKLIENLYYLLKFNTKEGRERLDALYLNDDGDYVILSFDYTPIVLIDIKGKSDIELIREILEYLL